LVLTLILAGFYALSAFAQTTADFTASTVCFGDSTTLTSTSSSTNPILQLNWDIDSNSVFTDDTGAVVRWVAPVFMTYRIGLQVITAVDTDVIYKDVVTHPVPVANFTIDFPRQCLTSNFFTYINTSSLASGNLNYFWDLGNGSTSNTAIDTNCIYFIAGTYTVTMAAISDMGCTDTVKKDVFVLTTSEVDFSINDTIQCLLGNDFEFTDNSLNCDPVADFSWDLDGDGTFGDSLNQSLVNHTFTTPGTYQVGLRITTTLGGVDSMYKNVYVYATPAAAFTITSDTGQCLAGNSFTFSNSSVLGGTGSMTYLWNYGDGDTSTALNAPAHTYASVAAHPVQLVATSDMGCKDSIINVATIFPQPSVDFSFADTAGCMSDTFFITNKTTIASPWNLTYNWDFGDGDTSTLTSPNHQYTGFGSFTVKLIAVSDSGCTDSLTKMTFVYANSIARFDVNDTDQCLNGNNFIFTDNSIGCSPIVSVLWDLDNDGIYNDGSGSTINHSFTIAGTYAVGMKLVTTTDSDSISVSVNVRQQPTAGFTVNDTSQSIGSNNFIFTNTSSISPPETLFYFWDFADGDTSVLANPTHSYATIGTYPVTLFVSNATGCLDSITKKHVCKLSSDSRVYF
ncbi:PKD domain-containing protein, partial [Bacteroidota bacterium]